MLSLSVHHNITHLGGMEFKTNCSMGGRKLEYFLVEQSKKKKYRKVASSRPVYYSIFYYFWGASNWDVLLTETCHYYHVQQSIKWWVQKRSHYLQITSKYSHLPWLVFYFCILHLTKRSKILWLIILIFLQMQFHK